MPIPQKRVSGHLFILKDYVSYHEPVSEEYYGLTQIFFFFTNFILEQTVGIFNGFLPTNSS